jgi:hypothetical protein
MVFRLALGAPKAWRPPPISKVGIGDRFGDGEEQSPTDRLIIHFNKDAPPGSIRRTRRGSKASDDRQQGSGRKKALGKRNAARGASAQLRRFGAHVISMGTGLFADLRTLDS